MKLKPSKKVIICEQPENKMASGLLLAEDKKADKLPELGIVIEIGEGKLPLKVKKGDTIIFRRYSANRILVKGKPFNFVDFKDLLAVIEE